ncbi:MAG TPA: hypothetical protein VHI11_02490 [Jiangellaceae bacterium]|nr:hypothetical protein [Jiangellaceae bacterium]
MTDRGAEDAHGLSEGGCSVNTEPTLPKLPIIVSLTLPETPT